MFKNNKILRVFLALNALCFSLTYSDESAGLSDEFRNMQAEFDNYKTQQNQEFADYTKSLEKEFEAYKKEIGKFWKEPKLSSKKEWISYAKDKRTRSIVDFEKSTLKIESVASSKEKALEDIKKQLSFSISADTIDVVQKDELQKKVAKLAKYSQTPNAKIDKKPILENILFESKPSKKTIDEYTQKRLKSVTIEKTQKGFVYTLNVALPKEMTLKRAKVYESEITYNAQRFKLPASLVFAITQTESNFNPFAKSHIPAYGLMQIVPWSAGVDTYKFLYNEKRKPSANYLYNSTNNIEMGSAYLHILYYKYLKKIKDPQSRLYCAIAGYNTGAGNIAWAFTHNHNINQAAIKINSMNSEEVYEYLLQNLKYDEPKNYLKRVRKRMNSFQKIYTTL